MIGPSVGFVVVDYKTPELADACIDSLHDHVQGGFGVVLIDAAKDGLSYSQAAHEGVRLLGPRDVVCILNADTQCRDSQWPILNLFAQDESIAVVGPRQVDENGFVRHGGIVGTNIAPEHRLWGEYMDERVEHLSSQEALDCVSVSGSVYYVRRNVWDELGGFLDTPHYFEETWLSYLARHRGYRVVYSGLSTWLHHWGSSPVDQTWLDGVFAESQALFRSACHREGIECD